MDEEELPMTIWDCGNCHYQVFENKSDKWHCSKYRKKSESKLKLKDDKKNTDGVRIVTRSN